MNTLYLFCLFFQNNTHLVKKKPSRFSRITILEILKIFRKCHLAALVPHYDHFLRLVKITLLALLPLTYEIMTSDRMRLLMMHIWWQITLPHHDILLMIKNDILCIFSIAILALPCSADEKQHMQRITKFKDAWTFS